MPLNAEPFPPGPSPGHFAAVGHCTRMLGCCCASNLVLFVSILSPPQHGSQFHGLCMFSQASLTRENFKSYLAASSFYIYFVWCKRCLHKYFVQIFCVQKYYFRHTLLDPDPDLPAPVAPPTTRRRRTSRSSTTSTATISTSSPPTPSSSSPGAGEKGGGGRLALALSFHGGSGWCCSRCWSCTDWSQGFHSRADLAKC